MAARKLRLHPPAESCRIAGREIDAGDITFDWVSWHKNAVADRQAARILAQT